MCYENLNCWKFVMGFSIFIALPLTLLNTIIIFNNIKEGVLKCLK